MFDEYPRFAYEDHPAKHDLYGRAYAPARLVYRVARRELRKLRGSQLPMFDWQVNEAINAELRKLGIGSWPLPQGAPARAVDNARRVEMELRGSTGANWLQEAAAALL